MTDQPKHTKLPWNVRDHMTPHGGRHIWVEGGPSIGETKAGPYKRQILEDEDYDEKAADAELIVTAANNHALLVEALRGYTRFVTMMHEMAGEKGYRSGIALAQERCRKELDRVETVLSILNRHQ